MIEPAPSHLLVQAVFLQLLGVMYLISFLSLLVQVRGLYGRRGVLPIAEFITASGQIIGRGERWAIFPSFFWLGPAIASSSGRRGCCAPIRFRIVLRLRLGVFRYRFSYREARLGNGLWWERELVGWSTAISLEG